MIDQDLLRMNVFEAGLVVCIVGDKKPEAWTRVEAVDGGVPPSVISTLMRVKQ